MRKNNKGITLIALVVTIIVLLILAGISIMTLFSDNGIITRTTKAKQIVGESEIIENIKIAYQNALIEKKLGENEQKIIEVLTKDLENVYGEGKVTITKDDNNYIVQIDGKKYQIEGDSGNVSAVTVEDNITISYIGEMDLQETVRNRTITLTLPDVDQSIKASDISWRGYDSYGILNISADGRSAQFTANQKGDVSIYVDINEIEYTSFPIHISVPIESINFDMEEYHYTVGDPGGCSFYINVEPPDADLIGLDWEINWTPSLGSASGNVGQSSLFSYDPVYVESATDAGEYNFRIYSSQDHEQLAEARVIFEWRGFDSFSLSVPGSVDMLLDPGVQDVEIYINPDYGIGDAFRYEVSDPWVAEIIGGPEKRFTIKALNVGHTTVKIYNDKYPGWWYEFYVNVFSSSVDYVTLFTESVNMSQQGSYLINMEYSPWSAHPDFYWEVDDRNVADISGDGTMWTIYSYSTSGHTNMYLYDRNDTTSRQLAVLSVSVE